MGGPDPPWEGATARGDKTAMLPFAKLSWTFVPVLFTSAMNRLIFVSRNCILMVNC